MTVTIRQLAELVRGVVVGDGDITIQAARTLQEAQPGDITFLDKRRHLPKLRASQASAAVVPEGVVCEGKTVIQSADPLLAFVAIMQKVQGRSAPAPSGVDGHAFVHPSVTIDAEASVAATVHIGAQTTIGKRCRLYPGVVIGERCKLGDDVTLFPNVVLYDDIVVGDRVIVHANAVLGADGFGYRFHQGRHVKIPQMGIVVIGNDVEIGAGTCVDRATFGATSVGDGTKLDNLVQVAHNCQVGKHNVIAAQCGIAGSSSTGSYVGMGGQAGVSDHVNVGDGAMLGAKTGVFRDIPAGQRAFLCPAFEEKDAARIAACFRRLPDMRRDIIRIMKELGLNAAEADAEELRKAS